jgi:two-component system phosphate regulon sensor histidine kinase PhoR
MATQIVIAVVLGGYAIVQLRQFHHEQAQDELARLGPFITAQTAPLLSDADLLRERVASIGRDAGVRVTIIDHEGTVLADSDRDPAEMDNHRYRAEIDAAFHDGTGSAVRPSATLGVDMMYVARRVDRDPPAVVRTALPMPRVNRELGRGLWIVGVAALASLMLTLGIIYLVSRRLSRSVSGLATAAGRFAAGELRHRVDRPPSRELASLADALNHMAGELNARIAQLQAQRGEQYTIIQSMSNGMIALDREQRVLTVNRAAERLLDLDDRTARGRLLQELIREPELNRFVAGAIGAEGALRDELRLEAGGGKDVEALSEPMLDENRERVGILLLVNDVTQLRRLERVRSDFAANVSHELRTPITNIKGYVETMLDVGWDDEEQTQEFLRVIVRATNRLDAIIEDLLALAELEQAGGPDRVAGEDVPVGTVVDAAATSCAHAAREKSISVRTEVEEDLAVRGSRHLLEQALGNLLSNAINYSPEATEIVVRGRADDEGMLELSVSDSGPGIAPPHLPRLFERFYRVDRARSRALGGTGLGLAIVKHIALVHGGRAEVESEVGVGSTFRLILPRA